jgi:hypothetical protein
LKRRAEEQPSVAWLDERLLLMAGASLGRPTNGSGEVPAFLRLAHEELPLEVESLWPAQRGNGVPAMRGLIVCRLPSGSIGGRPENVAVSINGKTFTITGRQSDTAPSDLSDFLRLELSGLEPGIRRQLMDSIVSACAPELERNGSTGLCRNLSLIRDVLREPLPYISVGDDEAQSFHIEELLAIDERSLWMRGWIWNAEGDLSDMTMVSPEGARTGILGGLFRYRRADVDGVYTGRDSDKREKGFFSFVETDVGSHLSSGWIAELRHTNGTGVEMNVPPLNRNLLEIREKITSYVGEVQRDKHKLVTAHAYPALSRLQARLEASTGIEITAQCGRAPHAPKVTIIVALGGQLDALEHQLCQLSDDPDVAGSDLIYVHDSQQDVEWLAPKALELHEIYGIPFRLAELSGKAGPTTMINKAASLARADRLLLLSPDVLPVARGWLGEMTTFYDSQELIGALGPMLLHDDESLQHAGLRLDPVSPQESGLPDGNGLEARSRFSGLPGALPAANEAVPVTAVSGACLMVDRALFESLGALRNIYAEGQVEDIDLCLRLWDAGRINWYLPSARMHYVEGRSEAEPTTAARQYNALLLNHLWRRRVASLNGAMGPG